MTGRVIESVSGCCKVDISSNFSEIINCKIKGIFRKNGMYPVTGDYVEIEILDDNSGNVVKICDRKNYFLRPNVANIDILVIIAAAVNPPPNLYNIDKLTVIAENKNVEVLIVLTKNDLSSSAECEEIYIKAGYRVITTNPNSINELSSIKEIIKNKTSVFTGMSGVGKSTILNKLDSMLFLETGEISEKLKSGKHTTRQCLLIKTDFGFVVDTPGFSEIEILQYFKIDKEELQYYFKEFLPFVNSCKFSTCLHETDNGCSVVKALKNNIISKSRYNSYIEMLTEIKKFKEWK